MAARKIVLDTNILARANPRARGPAHKLLRIITESPGCILLTSPFILMELERVLSYPRLQRIWSLQPLEIAEYIKAVETASELVVPEWVLSVETNVPFLLADPDDNPILQTALLGRAEVLCTLDRHFYKPDVTRFCQDRGIKIQNDVELLAELAGMVMD